MGLGYVDLFSLTMILFYLSYISLIRGIAYWANLFHYMLQGFCTNELVGRTYHLDLNVGIDTTDANGTSMDIFDNATTIVGFAPGVDSTSSIARQSANLLGLTSVSGGGINENIGRGSLSSLVGCLTENDCLVEPIASNFISCSVFKLFGTPPCKDEFDTATEGLDLVEIAKCFLPGDDGASTDNVTQIVPEGFSLDTFEATDKEAQTSTLLCLLRAVLPPGTESAIKSIVETIESLSGIVMFVLDILQNGLQIPGELILYFFGWAALTDDFEFLAPWKWWYCMGSVAIFLAAIEILKLFAVQKIVWTKR